MSQLIVIRKKIKKFENLPIGLFGDFYSHELSFNLIKENDYENLKEIFEDTLCFI